MPKANTYEEVTSMASALVEKFEQLETEAQFVNWLWKVLTDFCSADGHAEDSELYLWMTAEDLESPEEALTTIHNRYINEGDMGSYRTAVDLVIRESAERGDEKVHRIVTELARFI